MCGSCVHVVTNSLGMSLLACPPFSQLLTLLSLQVNNFFAWYRKYFHNAVHHHHDIEEKLYVPFINTRGKIPPKIVSPYLTSCVLSLFALLADQCLCALLSLAECRA
jgi:hypothetical protein